MQPSSNGKVYPPNNVQPCHKHCRVASARAADRLLPGPCPRVSLHSHIGLPRVRAIRCLALSGSLGLALERNSASEAEQGCPGACALLRCPPPSHVRSAAVLKLPQHRGAHVLYSNRTEYGDEQCTLCWRSGPRGQHDVDTTSEHRTRRRLEHMRAERVGGEGQAWHHCRVVFLISVAVAIEERHAERTLDVVGRRWSLSLLMRSAESGSHGLRTRLL